MEDRSRCWLVSNARSGSNAEEQVTGLVAACGAQGLEVVRHLTLPGDSLPHAEELDAAGIALLVIFAGDGTLNSALDRLAGWGGAVLALPGGTQNLLVKRLHGDAPAQEILAAVGAGKAVVRRPGVIRCPAGTAYAELQAGPGTAWQRVREAMREGSVLELAQEGMAATAETLGNPGVVCRDPALGRPEGYPMVVLSAHDSGIAVSAFHAEVTGDYLAQAAALLQRDFRRGPHDDLGQVPRVTLAATDGEPFGLLLDGEPANPGAACAFELAECGVDLLATRADG